MMTSRSTSFLVLLCLIGCGGKPQSAPLAPETTGYVQSGPSIRLFYRILGQGSDTVVVLHGGPGLHMQYLVPDLLPLARAHTLIFYDQRGGGRSTTPSDSTELDARRYVEDLEAVRHHFGLRQLTIIGHSWGGLLAGLYAQEHPDRVGRLLLLDSDPPSRVPWWPQFSPRTRLSPSDQARLESLDAAWRREPDPVAGCRAYWGLLIRGYLATETSPDLMRGDVCDTPQGPMLSPSRGYPRRSLGNWDLVPALPTFSFPVLIIHGREDPMPMAGAEAWLRGLPNARLLVIDSAAHFPHVERPEVFFPAAEAFLRGSWP